MSFNYLWTLKEATERMYQSFRDDIKNQWEKTDWRILKERDRKYIPVKIKERTRNTINGLVIYKCRNYKYYDEQLKKWVRVCLLDEELELPKYKITCQDIKNNVIEHFADGKRYVDILHTMKQTKFSTTSISRLFQEYQVNKLDVPKIKLEPNQFIYISIDDGHRKFWKFKRNSGKYSMRLVLFCTDNVNHKLVNKRADVIIRPTKTAIGVKKTAEFIKEQGNRFFENFEQAIYFYDDKARTAMDWLNQKLIDEHNTILITQTAIKHASNLNQEAGLTNRVVWMRNIMSYGNFYTNKDDLPKTTQCLEELRYDETKTNIPLTEICFKTLMMHYFMHYIHIKM
ncbi:hypothetical protein [Spiroplasma endosymbiont of Lasioglossum malachurum]|uniref:hypothetical protein n=1 Tax=Spiroplasma endosymbiont of Lasioglossum malachurum TaxID=3066319 RepID=UPI0030CB4E92